MFLNKIKRFVASVVLSVFVVSSVVDLSFAQNIAATIAPTNISHQGVFVPALLKGITINVENPLQLDFIVDSGTTKFDQEQLKKETEKLVKYFMASMTVPQNDLWVNLSPYEKDRIIPTELGKTELGRDLLTQDFVLKQLTSELMNPESPSGKKFWERIYSKVYEKFGTKDVPLDVFNKVWIMPDTANIYEHGSTMVIVNSRLKVLLDSDYQAAGFAQKTGNIAPAGQERTKTQELAEIIVREIILPEITKEVNEGESFAPLRQVYHSLILAQWYKQTIKNGILNQIYVDKNKVKGVDTVDQSMKDQVYQQYINAYKAGAFSMIKEDYDQYSQQVIPRKYFSGGILGSSAMIHREVANSVREAFKGRVATVTLAFLLNGQRVAAAGDFDFRRPIDTQRTLIREVPDLVTPKSNWRDELRLEVRTRLMTLISPNGLLYRYNQDYQEIVELGQNPLYRRVVMQTLRDVINNPNTDKNVKKWAIRLLGEIGGYKRSKRDLSNILLGHGSYTWFQQTEAANGLLTLFRRVAESGRIGKFKIQRLARGYNRDSNNVVGFLARVALETNLENIFDTQSLSFHNVKIDDLVYKAIHDPQALGLDANLRPIGSRDVAARAHTSVLEATAQRLVFQVNGKIYRVEFNPAATPQEILDTVGSYLNRFADPNITDFNQILNSGLFFTLVSIVRANPDAYTLVSQYFSKVIDDVSNPEFLRMSAIRVIGEVVDEHDKTQRNAELGHLNAIMIAGESYSSPQMRYQAGVAMFRIQQRTNRDDVDPKAVKKDAKKKKKTFIGYAAALVRGGKTSFVLDAQVAKKLRGPAKALVTVIFGAQTAASPAASTAVVEQQDTTRPDQLGGIDLIDINMNKQGQGVNVKFDSTKMQQLLNQPVDSVSPLIIKFAPVPNILPLLGLENKDSEKEVEKIAKK